MKTTGQSRTCAILGEPAMVLAALGFAACSTASPSPQIVAAPTERQPTAAPATPSHAAPAATAAAVTAPGPDLSAMSASSMQSVSPDGQWRAEAQTAFFPGEVPYDYARVTVTRTDQTTTWTPYLQLIEYGGIGTGSISDFYWSPDGQYLYFKHTAVGDGCGYAFTTDLHQVDLQDGSLHRFPLVDMLLWEITISPDVERMAYRVEGGIQLAELATGRSRTVPYAWPAGFGYLVSWLAWSPDGHELAFSITAPLCDSPEPPQTTFSIVDLDSGSARSVRSGDGWVYLPGRVEADPIPSAALALQEFLNSLYWGARGGLGEFTYARAAALYGGSYETLIDMNPDLEPGDHELLLRRACEVNGFQCLRLRDVVRSVAWRNEAGAQVVYLAVYLEDANGGIFALGPCCGEEGVLPEIWFSFTLEQSGDGVYRVRELPPYSP